MSLYLPFIDIYNLWVPQWRPPCLTAHFPSFLSFCFLSFFFSIMCVCWYECMFFFLISAQIAHACTYGKPEVNYGLHSLIAVQHVFGACDSHWDQGLGAWCWLSWELWGSGYLCLFNTGTCSHMFGFLCVCWWSNSSHRLYPASSLMTGLSFHSVFFNSFTF